jgi:hypothetical protein
MRDIDVGLDPLALINFISYIMANVRLEVTGQKSDSRSPERNSLTTIEFATLC